MYRLWCYHNIFYDVHYVFILSQYYYQLLIKKDVV